MREFLGLKVSFWWNLVRMSVMLYLVGRLVALVTDNGWIAFALLMPCIWEIVMVSSWLQVRAEVKAYNESVEPDRMNMRRAVHPWNWRLLISPALYYDWWERRDARLLKGE